MNLELQLLRTRHPPDIFLLQLILLLESEGVDIDEEQLRYRIERLPGDNRLILAVEGEHLYGYAHLLIVHDLLDTETAVLSSLIVREDHRRQGIGSLLVAAAETWARQSDRARLILRTDAARTGSHAFFAALGYEGNSSKLEFLRKVID